jgi:hypothetical protein
LSAIWDEKARKSASRIKRRGIPQPGEDEAKVVADCGEDGVGGIAFTAFEIAAREVTFALHVADRGTPSQLTFDDAEHATLLARDEDAVLLPADLRGSEVRCF